MDVTNYKITANVRFKLLSNVLRVSCYYFIGNQSLMLYNSEYPIVFY